MDGSAQKRVRTLSRELLGSSYRLEVAAAIHDALPEAVYARALTKTIEAKDNQVSAVLEHFEAAGLLDRLPTKGGRDPQRFQPRSSIYWEFCSKLLAEAREDR